MSDYMPTTEQVKNSYVHSLAKQEKSAKNIELYKDEFDLWLAQHDAEVAKETEERIIKLLRTELGPYLIWADDTPYIKGINLDGFIALIKGENK